MQGVEFFEKAMINGVMCNDVFKCHKNTRIQLSGMDMMISRELQENDIVAFTLMFGWRSEKNPLYALMMESKHKFINTEK